MGYCLKNPEPNSIATWLLDYPATQARLCKYKTIFDMENNLNEMLQQIKEAYVASNRQEPSDLMERDMLVITVTSISKPNPNGGTLRITAGKRITIATGHGDILHQQYTKYSQGSMREYLDIADAINRAILPGQKSQPCKESTGNTGNFFHRVKLLWCKLLAKVFYFKG